MPKVQPRRGKARGRVHAACGTDRWFLRRPLVWGCVACDRKSARERLLRRRRADPLRALLEGAKTRARRAGIPFSITLDDLRACWPKDGKCPVLGLALKRGANGKTHAGSPTLDRLNNAWGYEPGNIAIISHKANAAKGTMTATELERLAAWMRRQGLD